MTMNGCFRAFGLCGVRASELGEDGSRICPNPDGSAFDTSPVTFTATAEVSAGEVQEQRDGCGNICLTVRTPDITTGYSGSLELCTQNFELIVVLGNGTIDAIEDTGITIGFKYMGGTPDPVEFNLWQQSYSGPQSRATGDSAWLRHVFPFTQWSLSDMTFESGPNTTSLNFTSAAGSDGIGIGTFEDFADDLSGALYARWLEAEGVDPDEAPYNENSVGCGFIDSPETCSTS